MKKLVLFCSMLVLFLIGCGNLYSKESKGHGYGYMDVSPEKAYNMIKEMPEIIIVDVSPLYKKGHIPMAISAPIGDGTFDMKYEMWDKNKTYLIYCHADSPAIKAAKKLVKAGFKNVYRLKGNYKGWVDAGYPIEM